MTPLPVRARLVVWMVLGGLCWVPVVWAVRTVVR